MVKSAAKYVREKGLEPSNYIGQNDVYMLSGLVERGVSERDLRDFYKGGIKKGALDDLRFNIRQLPRENLYALEETGPFFQNGGKVQPFDPYLNPGLKGFFEMPMLEYLSPRKTKRGWIGKTGKAVFYASLIAALISSTFASSYSPSPEITNPYPIFKYDDKKLLDKDHNFAVSLPEMLGGLRNHGFGAIGSYIGHTFFFANLDPDGDNLVSSDEKNIYQTDPKKVDTDGDGIKDMDEIKKGYDPKNPDMNNDGVKDGDDLDVFRPGNFWGKFSEHPESKFPVPEGYKIANDYTGEYTAATKYNYPLKNGYSIALMEVDVSGNNAYLELYKDGKKIDSALVTPFLDIADKKESVANDLYTYGKVKVRFKDFFDGPNYALARIENDWDGGKEEFLSEGGFVDVGEQYTMELKNIAITGDRAYIELYYKWGTAYRDGSVRGTRYNYRLVDSKVVGPIKRISGLENYDYQGQVQVHFKDIMSVYSQKGNSFGLVQIDKVSPSSEDGSVKQAGTEDSIKMLVQGETLDMGKGYRIELADVDLDGEKAYVKLYKNKDLVDEKILGPFGPSTEENYQYGENISVHLKSFFCGVENKMAEVDFVRQSVGSGESHDVHESKEKAVISGNEPLVLGEGYRLYILGADSKSKKAWIGLYKNGMLVDNDIIGPIKAATGDELYVYRGSDATGKKQDFPVIAAHTKSVWKGSEADLITWDGIWQISEEKTEAK